MSWKPLKPGILNPELVGSADAYLRMAAATQFKDHFAETSDQPVLPVSVELKAGAARPALDGLAVPDAYARSRFFTARATPTAINALLAHPDVVRLQFAEAVLPQRPPRRALMPWTTRKVWGLAPKDELEPTALLLGVIDAGCPFAHAELRTQDGQSTRVVNLWDQEAGPAAPPRRMGYGQEFTRADLDQRMASARTAAGVVDEHACYLLAGADQVLAQASHGAHALGLLAGRHRINGQPGPGSALLTEPLLSLPGEAGEADIAFVQLPRKLLNAAFPPAVQHHALDALRHLLCVAKDRAAKRLVVCFAFESWVGPHDDSSWFDQAVDELLDTAGINFELILVAGNAGNAGKRGNLAVQPRHGVHMRVAGTRSPDTGRQEAEIFWRVQPDNQMTTYLELWVPTADGGLHDLSLEITPPGARTLAPIRWGDAVAWPDASRPALCSVMDRSKVLGQLADVVLLRLSPTRTFDARQGAAPHGEWSLRLRASDSLDGIHAYIGRASGNFGAQARGRQSSLTRRDPAQRRQDRAGTLNAYAGSPKVLVATACMAQDSIYSGHRSELLPGHVACYAGIGPSRDGKRLGPSFAVGYEYGPYHPGMIGIGNRSAARFRLIGTSVAGPLGARLRLDRGQDKDPPGPRADRRASANEVNEIGCERFPAYPAPAQGVAAPADQKGLSSTSKSLKDPAPRRQVRRQQRPKA